MGKDDLELLYKKLEQLALFEEPRDYLHLSRIPQENAAAGERRKMNPTIPLIAIAKEMGTTDSAVKSRLVRVRKKLRTTFGEESVQ